MPGKLFDWLLEDLRGCSASTEMPWKIGRRFGKDAAQERTGLPGMPVEEDSPPFTESPASPSGAILKSPHRPQSLAQGRLPDSSSQTRSLHGVLHCNLQVRRDCADVGICRFCNSEERGLSDEVEQRAEVGEPGSSLVAAPGKHYKPRAKVGTGGSSSRQRLFMTCHIPSPDHFALQTPKIFKITVGFSRVKTIAKGTIF